MPGGYYSSKNLKLSIAIGVLIFLIYEVFIHIHDSQGSRLTLFTAFRVCQTFEQLGGFIGVLASYGCSSIYLVFFGSVILMVFLLYYIYKNIHRISMFGIKEFCILLLFFGLIYMHNQGYLYLNPVTGEIKIKKLPKIPVFSSLSEKSKLSKYNIVPIKDILKNPKNFTNKEVCVYGILDKTEGTIKIFREIKGIKVYETIGKNIYYLIDKDGYFLYVLPEKNRKYTLNSRYVLCGKVVEILKDNEKTFALNVTFGEEI